MTKFRVQILDSAEILLTPVYYTVRKWGHKISRNKSTTAKWYYSMYHVTPQTREVMQCCIGAWKHWNNTTMLLYTGHEFRAVNPRQWGNATQCSMFHWQQAQNTKSRIAGSRQWGNATLCSMFHWQHAQNTKSRVAGSRQWGNTTQCSMFHWQ